MRNKYNHDVLVLREVQGWSLRGDTVKGAEFVSSYLVPTERLTRKQLYNICDRAEEKGITFGLA